MQPEVLPPKRPSWGTAVLLMIAWGLLGAGLGCLAVYAWTSGIFHPFRDLPAAPDPISQIAGLTVDTVDARAADGRLYRFDLRAADAGWQPVDSPRSETDEDCERFTRRVPRISAVRGRRFACENYADAGVTTIFALRENGRIAYWTRFDSAYMSLAAIIFVPLFAGLAGVIAGLVIFWIARRRRA